MPSPRADGSTSSRRRRAIVVGLFHQHHRAGVPAVDLGDPAAFALRIVALDEVGDDLRRTAPSNVSGPADTPAHRARRGARRSSRSRRGCGSRRMTLGCGRLLRPSSVSTVCIASTRRSCSGGGSRSSIAPTSLSVRASSGANALRPAGVIDRKLCRASAGDGVPADQPALFEAAQDAAEIAGIEIELARDVGRGRRRALGDLVEHAGFGERERAVRASRRRSTPMCCV